MKKDPEKKIEDFLFENPYLIDKSFNSSRPDRQERLGAHRTDLTFRKNDILTVVEIKRGPLSQKDLNQIVNYVELFNEKETLSEFNYLIGKKAKNADKFLKQAESKKIRVLHLGSDIPLSYLYDSILRKYIPYDENLADKKRYEAYYSFRI